MNEFLNMTKQSGIINKARLIIVRRGWWVVVRRSIMGVGV